MSGISGAEYSIDIDTLVVRVDGRVSVFQIPAIHTWGSDLWHEYESTARQEIPLDECLLWRNLLEDPAPSLTGGDWPVDDGYITPVIGFGDVTHYLDHRSKILLNVTMPNHLLHPGIAVRTIVDGEIYTFGFGNGPLGFPNEIGNYIGFWDAHSGLIYLETLEEMLNGETCDRDPYPLESLLDFMDGVKDLFWRAANTLSPLVLDLDGDGVETLGQNFFIHFGHDKNGFAERTGWVGADDGLLVLDRNGNGSIDNGSELFGNHSGSGPGPASGFAALAEFDSNLDGRINASDSAFASLRVWKDANSNGLTDAGELLTLQQAGVGSLSLSYTTGTAVDAQGNSHLQLGSYTTTQGALRQMTDTNGLLG
jgi:hypothetical protein